MATATIAAAAAGGAATTGMVAGSTAEFALSERYARLLLSGQM